MTAAEVEPQKHGAEALAEAQGRRERSRRIEADADAAFGIFTRYLTDNHWADRARTALKGYT